MTNEEALQWDDLIRKTVRFISQDFPDIDREELVQYLWEFVLTTSTLDDPEREGVASLLGRVARKQAWTQRKEHLQWTSQYSYRTNDVREILETSFTYNEWPSGYVPSDARSSDGMAAVDIRADVTWAFTLLPQTYQNAIISRYHHKVEPAANSSARKTLNRAVSRLTDVLNFYYPTNQGHGGPGSRKIISNVEAQYILEEQE